MKLHPFNLRRRYMSWSYRRKDFTSVKRLADRFLSKNPDDLFVLELRARAAVSLREWGEALPLYRHIFMIDPSYLDCSKQLSRCAIYTKQWDALDLVANNNDGALKSPEIQKAFAKKVESLVTRNFIEMVQFSNIIQSLPHSSLERWANLPFSERPKHMMAIDRYCLDERIGGDYLGHMLGIIINRSVSEARITIEYFAEIHSIPTISRWISIGLATKPDEMKPVIDWVLSMISPAEMGITTLESICVSEVLPEALDSIVKEFLKECEPDMIHEAIRAIGRRSDPSRYIDEDTLENMIESGSVIRTWMVEHALRVKKDNLIQRIVEEGARGTADAIINTMLNLLINRSDERLITLLNEVVHSSYLLTNQGIRHVICKTLLKIAEPIVAHSFAMECIQIEPQDAISGLIAIQSAIATGSPSLILETADVIFAMRSRSSNIDYASIAIAAIREGSTWYAEEILTENRLNMDVRAHRIRVGIPFHVHEDYLKTLEEVNRTPDKHRSDPTICHYHALTLSHLGKYEEALEIANLRVNDRIEKGLLIHTIIRMSGDNRMAGKSLQSMMDELSPPDSFQSIQRLPESWIEGNYEFSLLENPPYEDEMKNDESQPLVSVIMTTHRWNDAFSVAVNSILNQTYANIELIVVDDYSPKSDVKKYDKLLSDSRVVRIRMKKNVGTYACRNRGIESATGKFITFADSDDWNHQDRIRYAVSRMNEKDLDVVLGRFARVSQTGMIQFNGSRLSQFCLVGMMIRTSVLDDLDMIFDGEAYFSADSEFYERLLIHLGPNRVERYQRLDLIALHHERSMTGGGAQAIDWMGPGETRLRYVSGYRRYHNYLQKGNPQKERGFAPPSSEILTLAPTVDELQIRKIFEVIECNNEKQHDIDLNKNHSTNGDEINVFMATYPGGFRTVGKAIKKLLKQSLTINNIILHVNGNLSPPNLPTDKRLTVIQSDKNLADNGKFRHMSQYSGYFLTVDDDINYPHDYVEKMIEYVDEFNRKAMVGFHAADLPFGPPTTRWSHYKEMRRTHIFGSNQSTFTPINVIGTGTLAFHSDIGIPDWKKMDTLKMVDLHVAVWANQNNIGMYTCPRKKGWMKEFENIGDDHIWSQANVDRELQHQMIGVLKKVSIWDRLKNGLLKLEHGPISQLRGWRHREIPPYMELNKLMDWPDLPDNPKVTIYIPAYNTSKYIIKCVESALSQTYSNFEVSIHDDGSSDDTLLILQSQYGDNSQVILSTAPNQGIGCATNQAIRNGTGELILQLDSDDIIESDTLEILVDAIGKKHVCAYGNFRKIDSNGTMIDEGWEEPVYSRERLMRDMIIHPPRLFRRDAWEYVGCHDEKLINAEDFDLFLRLSEIGAFNHARKILYSYRHLDSSSSNANSDIMTTNTHTVLNRVLIRNKLNEYRLYVPNLNLPRSVEYQHVAFGPAESEIIGEYP